MADLVLEPTSTAQWHQLVHDAQAAAERHLDQELESYLVFLLMRFANTPQMLANVMALEYLESLRSDGTLRRDRLRDVGDRCLLFSGLFPQLAQHRRVSIDYYVTLGQGAYSELSNTLTHGLGSMYAHLSHAFVVLMDVLQFMRRIGQHKPLLDPLRAFELWSRTGSQSALADLKFATTAIPVVSTQKQPH